jgi:trimethylamine corrinoid protein
VEQKNVVEHFKRKGERNNYRIIVGGGVCSQKWAAEIGADGYARDANAAAALVAGLLSH